MKFRKMNKEPIVIDFKKYEPLEKFLCELEPCFKWNDKTYFLKDMIHTNNPWNFDKNLPRFIDAYDSLDTYNPIYIEIVNGYAVNIYECTGG